MSNFNGFVESGALSGTSPAKFYISENNTLEDRLGNLDPDMQTEIRKHLCDFHSENDMECFIDNLVHDGNHKASENS